MLDAFSHIQAYLKGSFLLLPREAFNSHKNAMKKDNNLKAIRVWVKTVLAFWTRLGRICSPLYGQGNWGTKYASASVNREKYLLATHFKHTRVQYFLFCNCQPLRNIRWTSPCFGGLEEIYIVRRSGSLIISIHCLAPTLTPIKNHSIEAWL